MLLFIVFLIFLCISSHTIFMLYSLTHLLVVITIVNFKNIIFQKCESSFHYLMQTSTPVSLNKINW